jgi:hypothetical protein
MTTDATKFMVPGGIAYPQAVELARQIDEGADAEKLVSSAFPDYMAVELANQIKSRTVNVGRLLELQMAGELANAFKKAIET